MRRSTRITLATLGRGAAALLAACGSDPKGTTVQSDNNEGNYADSPTVPTDTALYVIKGKVDAPVTSSTRQEAPGHGSYSQYGNYASGTYFGPVESGKGYVRLLVSSAAPATDLAEPSKVSILKVTDTKASALGAGDGVTFYCRRQFEAVAAVQVNQSWDDKAGVWELDFCRMASSSITAGEPATA